MLSPRQVWYWLAANRKLSNCHCIFGAGHPAQTDRAQQAVEDLRAWNGSRKPEGIKSFGCFYKRSIQESRFGFQSAVLLSAGVITVILGESCQVSYCSLILHLYTCLHHPTPRNNRFLRFKFSGRELSSASLQAVVVRVMKSRKTLELMRSSSPCADVLGVSVPSFMCKWTFFDGSWFWWAFAWDLFGEVFSQLVATKKLLKVVLCVQAVRRGVLTLRKASC